MLNDPLYAALRRVFGEVLVASEGERAAITSAPRSSVSRILRRKSDTVTAYGEQYRVNCPFCKNTPPYTPDNGQHLWISHIYNTDIQYDNRVVNFGWSPAKCYRRGCLESCRNKAALMAMIKEALDGASLKMDLVEERRAPSLENLPGVPLPPHLALTDPAVPEFVHSYLAGRGTSAKELSEDWGAVIGFTRFYERPALVFPIWQRGAYVSWQARFIGDDMELFKNGHKKPKYYIPSPTKKSWMLYNMDRAKYHSPGVLVEGIFDCIKVGEAGVCLFGKKPSLFQCRILGSLFGSSRLVWMPDANDPDSVATAEKMAPELMRSGLIKDVRIARLPYGDPGSFNRRELWEVIKGAGPLN